jgi:uncharacterized protein (DUF58 family)
MTTHPDVLRSTIPPLSSPHKQLPFEFNGVVRLTRVGLTYLAAAVILAVAAVNTGNNALYIAVAVMLGCLLLSGIASKDGLKRLAVTIEGIDEAWAGQPAHGVLRLHNGSRIWNVRDVVLTSETLTAPRLVPVIERGKDLELSASFFFSRRGLAHIGRIDSYTRYPFGFVLKKRRLPVSSDVVVYPRLLPIDTARERFPAIFGEESSTNRIGQGSDVHSYRDYARGDSMRQVHWKKSASIGRWIIKQTEAESGRTVHVIVDPFKPHGVSEERFEEMISAAATFIHDAVDRGMDIKLSLPRVTVRARKEESASPLFRALALIEALHEPVHQQVERHAVVFSVNERVSHDTQGA